MGEQSNKFHIDNDGHVFRVNVDGSFTDMGNISDSPKYDASRLAQIEQILEKQNETGLTKDDIMFCCQYSQNSDALRWGGALYDDAFCLLVKRFENGATFLEDAALNGAELCDENDKDYTDYGYDCVKVKLALAKCKRPFSDEGILRTLAKDKNPKISYAAKSNPHYKKSGGCGCFSVIIIAFVVGASYYLF